MKIEQVNLFASSTKHTWISLEGHLKQLLESCS